MVVRQGDLYWVDVGEPSGSEPGYRRPYVVVQNDVLNASRLRTVVMCSLTSNLRLAAVPGNVLLPAAEGGLPRPSVVNVTQLFTVDKSHLDELIGAVSPPRLDQILAGIRQILEPTELVG